MHSLKHGSYMLIALFKIIYVNYTDQWDFKMQVANNPNRTVSSTATSRISIHTKYASYRESLEISLLENLVYKLRSTRWLLLCGKMSIYCERYQRLSSAWIRD